MIYPRVDKEGTLVTENQMVSSSEHLLQKHRMVSILGALTGELSAVHVLWALDSISHEPIKLVITSPGGDLDSAFLLYDTIKTISSPVWTLGRYCASAAALLLASGSRRVLMSHAKVMLHLPSGQLYGDATDWEIQQREMIKYKDELVSSLQACGVKRTKEEILMDINRDRWFNAEEAITYGLADEIMTKELWGEWLGCNA